MKRKNYRHRSNGSGVPSIATDGAAVANLSHCESVPHPPAVAWIADAWPGLPPHIREAVLTLVDAGLMSTVSNGLGQFSRQEPVKGGADPNGPDTNAVAWRIARQCRDIVQGCLREEEWHDADLEFFAQIKNGIAELTSSI